jgi:hypothetical protein
MKNTILDLINSDTSYNKNVSRYLYKTHPDLWRQILDETNFLPPDAKPKQRVWHIINDVYIRPVCPITGEFVKWWENRYLETANRSAKAKNLHSKGIYINSYTEEINKKRSISNKQRVIFGRKYRGKATDEEKQKRKETNLKKFGVESNLLLKETHQKQYLTKVEKGIITPREKRSLRDLYYSQVAKITKLNWIENFDKINPFRLDRSKYNLDHIFSIQEGFRQSIPPYIIGHWTNLRMLEAKENYSKGRRCDKTKNQLFTDFFN